MTDYPKTTKFSPPDNLSVFESAVVQAIVFELNLPVPMEMEKLRVFERQLSGAGLFVEFAIYDSKSNVDEQFVSDIYAEVLGADQGVGFVLCATEQQILTLEVYAHGGTFPDEISFFELYLNEKLIASQSQP